MKIINPITYNYFNNLRNQKRITKNIIKEYINLFSNVNIYFIEINSVFSKSRFKGIIDFIEIMESNKNNVDKFCNNEEKKRFSKTLKDAKDRIEYINKALKDNYDTIVANKKINDINTYIELNITLDMFKEYSMYNENMLNYIFIDRINIKQLNKEKLDSFLKIYLAKMNFNNKYAIDNLNNSNINETNIHSIKSFSKLEFKTREYGSLVDILDLECRFNRKIEQI